MQVVLRMAAEGKTDNDLAAAAMEFCVREGGEFFCIEPIISLGARSGVPHCTFARNRIEKGDLCFVEIGACVHRYSGPLIRTFSIGEPGVMERRVCDEVQASLDAVIDTLRPGIPAREVALKARKPWEWTYTNKELFWNGAYAYSTGLGFPPDWGDANLLIREEDDFILTPGMVFHCTNNVRKGGIFGVGISETVAITETGCEVLTNLPRKLFVL
jgi:Xaa-Pro dipeptidase